MGKRELALSMKDTIKDLLTLRDLDKKLAHLNRRLKDGPRILDKRKAEFEESKKSVEKKRESIKSMQLTSKEREVDLQALEENIKKQETYLLGAKTNQEYSTIQGQIAKLKDDVGRVEEEILAAYEGVEAENKVLREMEQELAIQEKEFNAFRDETQRDLDAYNTEIETIRAKREDQIDAMNFEAVQLYEKVNNARDGDAVVSVEGHTCGGCYMTVTANDIARLRGMNQLVLCKSCQRILYLADMLD